MIIIKYLVKKTLKNQLAILVTLLLVFFCQKLIKILNSTINGEIPINQVFLFLGLSIPEIAQFILPLSLFLGLLITLNKLYAENEITVMYACGINQIMLIKTAMILALFTCIITTVNVMWIKPWSSRYHDIVLMKAKNNLSMITSTKGQFQQIKDGHSVLFIENINGNCLYHVFLAQMHSKFDTRPSIIIANSGKIKQYKDGSQIISLNKGTIFERLSPYHNFRITDFENYEAVISHQVIVLNTKNAEQMNIKTLWNNDSNEVRTELHWRLTLILTLFIMALIAVPMSTIDYRKGRILFMLPTMLLYIIFFLLQTTLKAKGNKSNFNAILMIWLVNSFYILLAILLNLQDTILARRMRANLTYKGIT